MPKAKPISQPFNAMKTIFLSHYESHTQLPYQFSAMDGRNLKRLITKLENSFRAVRKYEPTEEDIILSFSVLMERLPQWYKENGMSIAVINSKYNDIILKIRKQSSNQTLAHKLMGEIKNGK